jgi:hypothetical protein
MSDEELTELLLDGENEQMPWALDSLPASLRAASEQPGWFWQRQQAAIRGRIAAREHAWLRPLTGWAGALGLIVVGLLLLNGSPAPKPAQARIDPDQELLYAVEDAVSSEVPAALEPAALLADEITNAGRPSAARHASKENQDEN